MYTHIMLNATGIKLVLNFYTFCLQLFQSIITSQKLIADEQELGNNTKRSNNYDIWQICA